MTDAELNTTDTPTTAPAGPVTLDDVRAALAGTDPHATNAGALRKQLGNRGSFSTIQKHLDALRAELLEQSLEVSGPAPDAPKDLISAIWSSAWAAAQARTAGALAAAQQKTQTLAQALAVAQADAAAAQMAADDSAQALAKSEAAREQQIADEGVKLDEAGARVQQLEAQLALAHVEITSLKQQIEQAAERAQRDAELARRDTAQAVELAKRDADLKDAAHRMDREHLINQIAELKALLYRPALAAPVGMPAAPTDDI